MTFESLEEMIVALCEPFPSDEIEWRVGTTNKRWRKEGEPLKGLPLCYIDARAVMDRLDSVCGPENWQDRYPHANGKTVCEIGIRICRPDGSSEWVWKSDGAGDTDMEAEKGALSDAFKRAAVRWGVGRYLYEIKAPKIELELRGETPVIPDSERKKLIAFYEDQGARQAGWGSRAGGQVYRLLIKTVNEFVHDAASAQEFRDLNKGEIALLPAKMKQHLFDLLDRVGAPTSEAAE
jgi:hypothetical protein